MSAFVTVAIALIQFGSLFSADTPCASVLTHSGFFFIALHKHNELKVYKIIKNYQFYSQNSLPIITARQEILFIYQFNTFYAASVSIVN